MWFNIRKGRSRYARKRRMIETLEVRQMMAADTLAQPLLSISNPTAIVAVRTYDGSDNNLANPQWGSTDEQLLRVADAAYTDAHWPRRPVSPYILQRNGRVYRSGRIISAFEYR